MVNAVLLFYGIIAAAVASRTVNTAALALVTAVAE